MSNIINMATAEQRAQFMQQVSPDKSARARANNSKAPKGRAKRSERVYVETLLTQHDDGYELQLPIIVEAQHGYARASRMVYVRVTGEHVDHVLMALRSHLKDLPRDQVMHITFTRVSLQPMDDDDNLPWSLKHIKDATCAWLLCGDGDINRKRIGDYDKRLKELGKVKWHCEQKTNDEGVTHRPRRKPAGIRIRFHLS